MLKGPDTDKTHFMRSPSAGMGNLLQQQPLLPHGSDLRGASGCHDPEMCVCAGRWWAGAEKPWQCLAACIEVRDALASGNPEAFRSRLPVQMDGSCNGLQHYAALGRDSTGGAAVNLRPATRPQVLSFVQFLICRATCKTSTFTYRCKG